jgi:hypothetical protein
VRAGTILKQAKKQPVLAILRQHDAKIPQDNSGEFGPRRSAQQKTSGETARGFL